MSHGNYGKGCVKWNVTDARNYKPLIAFVLIDELIFLALTPIAGRLGFQMAFTTILWAATLFLGAIMWKMRLFRNAGFRAWVIVFAALTLGHLI